MDKGTKEKDREEDLLTYLTDLFEEYLFELKETKKRTENQFAYGEKVAYTECLDLIRMWRESQKRKLDFSV